MQTGNAQSLRRTKLVTGYNMFVGAGGRNVGTYRVITWFLVCRMAKNGVTEVTGVNVPS